MTDNLPAIEGSSEPTSEPKERGERQQVLTQAKQMDMEVPQTPDEVHPSRDIKDNRTIEDKLDDAEVVAENNLSTQNEANLPKAKKNAATTKRRTRSSTAIGNEAPQYLVDLSNKVNLFYDEFKQSHSLMQNLEKKFAHQAPLQQNQIVHPSRKRNLEMPHYANDRIEVRDDHETYPLSTSADYNYASQQYKKSRYEEDENTRNIKMGEQFKRRNQAAMETVIYQNKNMEDRAQQDQTSGHRASSLSSSMYW